MGNGFQFLDIILLAAIAGFLILRLRSVLGRRTGHEQPPQRYDPFAKEKAEDSGDDKVVHLPDRGQPSDEAEAPEAPEAGPAPDQTADADTPLAAGLTQIKLADRDFDEKSFQSGAKMAFEMIIGAFSQGDSRALRPLLSNDVYEDFSGAIKAREEADETLETTLVGINEAELIEAELQGKTAFATIKFVSEQVNVTRDAAGEVVDGDPNTVTTITDIWTFARNTRSRDPNWTLVATRSSN
jgi:predicted lipid-binding transport protein (Tim44 family)